MVFNLLLFFLSIVFLWFLILWLLFHYPRVDWSLYNGKQNLHMSKIAMVMPTSPILCLVQMYFNCEGNALLICKPSLLLIRGTCLFLNSHTLSFFEGFDFEKFSWQEHKLYSSSEECWKHHSQSKVKD